MDWSTKRISFEFFPPKSTDGMQNLLLTAGDLSTYLPAFFSVTFGAGNSTRDRTIETISTLKQAINPPVIPHISCLGYNQAELRALLEQYKKMNIKRLVVLRGDMVENTMPSGDFVFAADFVKFIRDVSGDYFHIEVAAYPEFHPQAATAQTDIMNLKKKYELGANSAITQYFFNVDAYFYFLEECEKQHINMPIYPGIMPIMEYGKLMRFSMLCGAEVPRWLMKRLENYGDDIASLQAFGTDVVSQLCEQLVAGGAPGLHFYTLNQASLCQTILEKCHYTMPHVTQTQAEAVGL